MPTARLIVGMLFSSLLAGCVTGPSHPTLVIETGAPELGDAGYARALAMRMQTDRRPTASARPLASATGP